jgi:hypothetical protein
MKSRASPLWKDCVFLLGAAFFFFGCIASAHRSGRTLDSGQFSVSGSYLRAENMEESDAEQVQLVALDGRFGLIRGLDMGVMHTWDISKDNDNMFATFWGDFKVQLTNRDNLIGRPIFSTGLMKGYVYDENAELHITTLPVWLSIPVNEYLTPYFMYRFEKVSDDFMPEDLEDERSTFVLGTEINLVRPTPHRWMPKLGLSIGTFNSLMGGEGDRGLTLNLGLCVDSPRR